MKHLKTHHWVIIGAVLVGGYLIYKNYYATPTTPAPVPPPAPATTPATTPSASATGQANFGGTIPGAYGDVHNSNADGHHHRHHPHA